MAELITTERREVTMNRLAEECRRLQAERDMALRMASAQPVAPPRARNNVPWIVTGVVLSLMMLVSLCWSVFTAWMDSMEQAAARHHELALAAIEASPVPTGASADGDMAIVGAAIALALVMIVIRLLRR